MIITICILQPLLFNKQEFMMENKSPLAVLTGSAPARDKVVSVNFVTENYATQNSLMTIFSR